MKQLFTLLFGIFIVFQVNSQQALGFYQDQFVPRAFNVPLQSLPGMLSTGSQGEISLGINSNDTVAAVLPTQFGTNANYRSGTSIMNRTEIYKNKGNFGVYRFPAGSGSNQYFWDGEIPSSFETAVNPIDGTTLFNPPTFAQFLDSVNGEATVVVNYFYARYGLTNEGTREARVAQAAHYAADFVRYMNLTLGAGIKNWEIGNECYGNWETGYNVNGSIVSGTEYGEDFRVFADSMKMADPTIKVGAVLIENPTSNWNTLVLPEIQNHADFLILHNYFVPNNNTTSTNILFNSRHKLEDITEHIRNQVATYTNHPSDFYPISLTEYNSRGPLTTSMLNGIFFTHVLGEVIRNKIGLATSWVNEWGVNGPDYNDTKGLLAKGDPDQDDYTPRTAFIPYYMFSRCFGDHMIESTSSDTTGMAFVSTFQNGEKGIAITNPTAEAKTLKIQGLTNENTAYWYEFYADNINAGNKKFYINGLTGITAGGGPALDSIQPFRSMYNDSSVFVLKPWSSTFIVLSHECLGNATDSLNITGCDSVTVNNMVYYNSGTYEQWLQTSQGCDSLLTIAVALTNTPMVTVNQLLPGELVANTNAQVSYQWINCNNNEAISGATNSSFSAPENGEYAVIVSSGSCETTSECISVTELAVKELNDLGVTIWPNPTSDKYRIQFKGTVAKVTLYDARGSIISESIVNSGDVLSTKELDAGIYKVKLEIAHQTVMLKLVKM